MENYRTIDVTPTSKMLIDPTKPGQLASIPQDAHQEIVGTVYRHLPVKDQTDENFRSLFECLVHAPNDFAQIAGKYCVGNIEVVNNHLQHTQNEYHLQHTQNEHHFDNRSYQPSFQPVYNPIIEFRPIINIDAHSSARSKSKFHQEDSGHRSDTFIWTFFLFIFALAFAVLLTGK